MTMFGDLAKVMKLASQMKTALPAMQARLAESLHTAQAGGGAVRATVNGRGALTDLTIEAHLLADCQADPPRLAELVKQAVCAAQEQAAEAARKAMEELTGGINLPGLSDMI
jgi:DNA-binding protein YbaB